MGAGIAPPGQPPGGTTAACLRPSRKNSAPLGSSWPVTKFHFRELFSLGVLKKKELSDVSIAVEAETEAATENKEAVR